MRVVSTDESRVPTVTHGPPAVIERTNLNGYQILFRINRRFSKGRLSVPRSGGPVPRELNTVEAKSGHFEFHYSRLPTGRALGGSGVRVMYPASHGIKASVIQ